MLLLTIDFNNLKKNNNTSNYLEVNICLDISFILIQLNYKK